MIRIVSTILIASLLGAIGLSKITHTQQETPVPAQDTVMTAKQKEHSKLYAGRGAGKKLRDMTTVQNGKETKTDIDIITPPPLPELSPTGATSVEHPLENLACEADAIVIGRIKEKLSFATEDEKYIFTENVMNIDDVLKDGPVHIVTDSEITITVPGGTIQLDGRRFRAIDRSFKPFEVGDHYLLLLKFVAETGDYKPVNSRSSFLIRDNKAEELTEEQMQGFINGRDAASLINELRAVAQVNNCKNGKGE